MALQIVAVSWDMLFQIIFPHLPLNKVARGMALQIFAVSRDMVFQIIFPHLPLNMVARGMALPIVLQYLLVL
jgi:hypothetical protein